LLWLNYGYCNIDFCITPVHGIICRDSFFPENMGGGDIENTTICGCRNSVPLLQLSHSTMLSTHLTDCLLQHTHIKWPLARWELSAGYREELATMLSLSPTLTFQSLQVTWSTNSLTFSNCSSAPAVFTCWHLSVKNNDLCHSIKWLVFITEMKSVYSAVRTGSLNTAVCACATYSINWLVFITEMKSVYSAVRTGSLNKAVCACATFCIKWLAFITEMKSVYSAVRTGSLNKAVCASSLKG
jgi:hypothetical protein